MEVPEFIQNAFNRLSRLSTYVEFQTELMNCVRHETGNEEEFLQQFKALEGHVAKVDFLYERVRRYDMLKDKFTPEGKSDWRAENNQREGNLAFATGKFMKAVELFTRVIMDAETPKVKAHGYANRSASLYKLKLNIESLADIERALHNGYPQRQRQTLISRRAKIAEEDIPRRPYYHGIFEFAPNKLHPHVPTASNKLRFYTDIHGRRRVSTRKQISIGEVLLVEPAFTMIASTSNVIHCSECLVLCYNPIPCTFCCQVVYCTRACREKARRNYHDIECPLLITLRNLTGDQSKHFLLALKTAIINLRRNVRIAEMDRFEHLIGNLNREHIDDHIFTYALLAAMFIHLMRGHTAFFANTDQEFENRFKDELVMAMKICVTFGAGIDESVPNEDFNEDNELMRFRSECIGSGIYPFYSLFGHACCVNAVAHHHGSVRIIRAMRTIKRNQEILMSYGPIYTHMPREQRQQFLLDKYHFTCSCKACRENWPQLSQLPYYVQSVKNKIIIENVRKGTLKDAISGMATFVTGISQFENLEPHSELFLYHNMMLYVLNVIGSTRTVSFNEMEIHDRMHL